MIPQQRLNDVFPGWTSGGGIFTALQEFPVPWKENNISLSLDIEYHGNLSGDKIISPMVSKILTGEALTQEQTTLIATAIMALCGVNWGKQWQTMSFEYNPIENYSMTEQMEGDKTVDEYGRTITRTDDLIHGKTGTDTVTPNINEVTTPDLTTNQQNTVNGFNSTVGVPTGEQSQKATGTNTVSRTGNEQTTYNTQDTNTGTQTTADGGQDTHTRNYKLTRSGNIGVTTSQQMIESERNLWVWNYFRDVVFPDIDRVLTIQIY